MTEQPKCLECGSPCKVYSKLLADKEWFWLECTMDPDCTFMYGEYGSEADLLRGYSELCELVRLGKAADELIKAPLTIQDILDERPNIEKSQEACSGFRIGVDACCQRITRTAFGIGAEAYATGWRLPVEKGADDD